MNGSSDISTDLINRSVDIAAALRELDTDLPLAAALEEQATTLDRARIASTLLEPNRKAERD
jgi:hypothetical protein